MIATKNRTASFEAVLLIFQRFSVHAAILDLSGTTFGYERFWRDMSTKIKRFSDTTFKSLCNRS